MKFLCDVHISFRMKNHLVSLSFDALHVNNMPDKWHTKDADISAFADEHDLIVITKDVDFRNAYLIRKTPKKLVKISLGNIANDELIKSFERHLDFISQLDKKGGFLVELDKEGATWMSLED